VIETISQVYVFKSSIVSRFGDDTTLTVASSHRPETGEDGETKKSIKQVHAKERSV
jgi:hypothetical protein